MFRTKFTAHAVRTFVSILVTLAATGCGTLQAAGSTDQLVESLQNNKGAL